MKHACQRVSQLTSDSFERKLSFLEKLHLYVHIAMCGLCRNYRRNLQYMHDVFAHIRNGAHPKNTCLPEESKARILSALKKD